MSTHGPTPWDLYAKTMFNHFGYPLWHADPEIDANYVPREVELGSVGCLNSGRFHHFFNVRKPEDDPFNTGRVPPTFEPFNPPNLSISPPQPTLRQPYVASGSVAEVAVLVEGGAASPVASLFSGGGSVSFQCKQNAGALLVLEEPGMGQSIPTKRHIVTYLRKHMDSWFEWLNSAQLGYEVKMHDIKFVSGTLKCSKWACAAFSGSYRNKKGSMTLNVAGVGDVNMNVAIKNQVVPSQFYNHGPTLTTATASRISMSSDHLLTVGEDGGRASSSPPSPMPPACDQCIFFHYFAFKKRLFLKVIKAAAGPHELPSDHDSDIEGNSPILDISESAAEYDITEQPSSGELEDNGFDPVAVLLDYMLIESGAEYAIASDRDVLAIFGAAGVPDDIMAGLKSIKPPIEVDENDVATVTVDTTWLDQLLSGETAMQSTEAGNNPLGGAKHIEESSGTVAESQVEQFSATPATEDQAQGEGDEGNDDDEEAARRVKQAIWEPAVNAHTGSVTSLAFSPDNQWVASGSDDTMIILWEAETQSVVRKWESHDDIVWHLAFSPDSLRLASSGGEGHIVVWDVDTGEQLATLEGHAETIHTVVWSPDGTKLASGSDDMTVRIWDAQTYEQLHLLEGHNAMVTFVLFSHNGQYLASGGADYNTRLWDVATGVLHKELKGHRGMVWAGSFDPEDNRLATASDDGSVRIWKVDTGEELVMLHEHHGPVWAVSFSPGDGKQVLSGSSDSTLKICDSFTGERVVGLEGHDSMINSARFSPDGRFVASASSDNTVRLWRRRDGTNMKTFNEHNDKVTHVVFSPDGTMLASGSDDGTVRIRILKDFVNLD